MAKCAIIFKHLIIRRFSATRVNAKAANFSFAQPDIKAGGPLAVIILYGV